MKKTSICILKETIENATTSYAIEIGEMSKFNLKNLTEINKESIKIELIKYLGSVNKSYATGCGTIHYGVFIDGCISTIESELSLITSIKFDLQHTEDNQYIEIDFNFDETVEDSSLENRIAKFNYAILHLLRPFSDCEINGDYWLNELLFRIKIEDEELNMDYHRYTISR